VQKSMRFVIAGVALGAILGAVVALVVARVAQPDQDGEPQEPLPELGASRIARLGLLVLGAVREILSIT